ncbi:hypothetical protein [Streptomyces sp. NPDC096153]|uniref:hypothetical protein n=1 Tax=Streptomyces sp. NPDC096153 TaxID=3155548 RepID=UPI00331BEBCE
MNSLTILVPTRGRPDNLAALWQAFAETCTGETRLQAWVDDDDPQLEAYEQVHRAAYDDGSAREDDPRFLLMVGPRLRLGPTLNIAAPNAADWADAVGFMGDDHRPKTPGWDTRYMAALERLGTGIVYGNDLIQGRALPTQMAMTSDIIKATGHIVPPGAIHLWLDNAWLALGEALGAITYLPDVVVEHQHPIAGKAQWDAGYAECNTDAVSTADRQVFEQWRQQDLPRWVEQVRRYSRV